MRKAYRDAGLDPRETAFVEVSKQPINTYNANRRSVTVLEHLQAIPLKPRLWAKSLVKMVSISLQLSPIWDIPKDPQDCPLLSNVFSPSSTISFHPTSNLSTPIRRVGIELFKAVKRMNQLTHLQVPFAEYNLTVPVKPTPFPSDRKQRVSIDSFGIGGSNAHVRAFPTLTSLGYSHCS